MLPGWLCLAFGLAAASVGASPRSSDRASQDDVPFEEEGGIGFRVSGEVKANYRWSQQDRFPLTFFPADFVPQNRDNVALATVSPGSSLEVSKATLFFDVDFPRSISGRVKIDFVDLYDRNPTSSDRKLDVDEAYLRFGTKFESLDAITGSHAYALFGKAPKFERQLFRRLESYGLVQTAFNRFNDLQLQFGGSLGANFYFRGQVSNGNPHFFRDPNALAGDNGVAPPPTPELVLDAGFPIFYHAEVEELAFDDNMETGFGAGVRFLSESQETGLDILGFYYRTTLSEEAQLHGTFYEGDLDILNGAGVSLPIDGDERTEWGVNVDFMVAGIGGFFQFVDEEAASLPRRGFELELGYDFIIGDPGDPAALFPVVSPVFRFSRLDNDFVAPPGFVAPSVMWDWTKIDIGVRVVVVPNVDLTAEYSFHDIDASRPIDHDELLVTLRFRFP